MTSQDIRFRIDTGGLEDAFSRGPATSYYWLRSWLFRALLEHRIAWLRSKSTRFGRGKDAIKVWQINQAPSGPVDPKHVVYRVDPEARKVAPSDAPAALQSLTGEAFAGSVALEVHQFGTDIEGGGKWLPVPIGRGPGSPRAWRAKFPQRTLLTVPDRKRSDRLFLMERKRYRGRSRSQQAKRGRQRKVVRDLLIPRFVLVRRLDMQPTLGFYETWEAQASARLKDFASISTRILQDLARGKLA